LRFAGALFWAVRVGAATGVDAFDLLGRFAAVTLAAGSLFSFNRLLTITQLLHQSEKHTRNKSNPGRFSPSKPALPFL
jgi:hypothetical protein